MDPIAHTLVGAGMAEAGLARRTRLGVATLIVGANLPDVDVLAYAWGPDAALAHRRGLTHGVLGMVALPLLLAGIAVLASRWRASRDRAPAPSLRWLLVLACLSVWSHPLLDWLNTYGLRPFAPFDDRWLYGDVLFIVDPWIWLLLGGMLFVTHGSRVVGVLLVVLALAASLLLFSSPLAPTSSRAAWLAGIVAVTVLRRVVRLDDERRTRIARIALALTLVYVMAMTAGALAARRLVAAELRRGGLEVESLMVGPLPADPLRREVVAATAEQLHLGSFRWLEAPRLEMGRRSLPRPSRSPVVEAALRGSCVRGFVSWVRFPFVEVDRDDAGWTVFVLDARYTRQVTEGFGGVRVRVGEDLRARCPSGSDPDTPP